jgi:hypothetical protein
MLDEKREGGKGEVGSKAKGLRIKASGRSAWLPLGELKILRYARWKGTVYIF